MFVDYIMPLLGVLLIIGLAYFGTGWVAKKYAVTNAGKNMRVVERLSLGTDKHLLIVQAGDKTLLLAASGKSVEVLTELDGQALQPAAPPKAPDFSELLKKAGGARPVTSFFKRGGTSDGDRR